MKLSDIEKEWINTPVGGTSESYRRSLYSNKQFISERIIDNGKQGCVQIPVQDIINQIQEIRSRNNKNWMKLSRLIYVLLSEDEKKIVPIIANFDEEEKRREINNVFIVNILRFAFKYIPNEAKKIMADITECDSEINKLSKRLAEND